MSTMPFQMEEDPDFSSKPKTKKAQHHKMVFKNQLGPDLAGLLSYNERGTKVVRNTCFFRAPRDLIPYRRRLLDYYKTCMAVRKEIEDPATTIHILDTEFDDTFEVEVIIEAVRYRHRTLLPTQVRPYFEDLLEARD